VDCLSPYHGDRPAPSVVLSAFPLFLRSVSPRIWGTEKVLGGRVFAVTAVHYGFFFFLIFCTPSSPPPDGDRFILLNADPGLSFVPRPHL